MLAEGIADAQTSLDRASADLVEELAATTVSIVPQVTETIDEDGKITFEQAEPQEVSLLSLGVTPTFYQFSQATVEVVMDIKVVEQEQVKEDGKRSYGLFAGTADVRDRAEAEPGRHRPLQGDGDARPGADAAASRAGPDHHDPAGAVADARDRSGSRRIPRSGGAIARRRPGLACRRDRRHPGGGRNLGGRARDQGRGGPPGRRRCGARDDLDPGHAGREHHAGAALDGSRAVRRGRAPTRWCPRRSSRRRSRRT